MLILDFLKAILPEEGVKCWTSIHNGVGANHFCNTLEELAEQIITNDARGVDTYHACATFKTNQSRRAANAEWFKSFRMDIDVGGNKPYATIQDAIQACDEFCNRCSIDLPGLVKSGYGLHAYWPLDQVLTSAEWSPVAQRLKLLAQATGLLSNPSDLGVIADPARILRSPGTQNYKIPGHPKPVEVIESELFAPVSFSDFSEAIINYQYEAPAVVIKPPSMNDAMSAGIAGSKAFDPTKGIPQGGRGYARVRYAGELVARGYTYDDVLARIKAWDLLCQPPEGEAACLHSVKSAFNMHAQKHPTPAIAAQPVNGEAAPVAPTGNGEALPPCPWGFKYGNAMQIMAIVTEKDAAGKPMKDENGNPALGSVVITNLPFYMEAWLNSEGMEQHNAYQFRAYHPKKGWYSFHLNAEEVNGERITAHMATKGVSIMDGQLKLFRTYINRMENMLRLPGDEKTQYGQFGWKDTSAGPNTAFLVGPNLCYSDGRVEQAAVTNKLTAMQQAMRPAVGGSREAWSMAANKLSTPGLEAHLFMVVCSFASALMKHAIDEGNGGSIISIVSEDSGKGKTPMATGMASVWGTLQSIVSTGNFTGNRLIDDVVRRCNIIQVQEEMPYSDQFIAADGVKRFTSGSDRGRLDQGGNAKGMPERYQTLLVSISNKSLYGLVRMADIPMSCRIFELDLNDTDDSVLSNIGGIAREMMTNCGYAGRDFARLIVNPELNKYITQQLRGLTSEAPGTTIMKYRDLLQSRPEHRFIVAPLACVDVASQILNHYGIMQFDIGRLMDWVTDRARLYTEGSIIELASTKLDAFIREHINTCVTVPGPFQPGTGACLTLREPSGARLYMRMEARGNRLYIAVDPLREWCTKHGISMPGMAKKLKESGVLVNSSKPITLGAGTNIISSRCMCWEINTAHESMGTDVREGLIVPLTTDKVVPIKG